MSRIVVGVDGSEPSTVALEFAFEAAGTRRSELVMVRTWSGVLLDDVVPRGPLRVNPAEIEANERSALEEQVRPWRNTHPDVPVETVVVKGRPARTLLGYADRARLLVVGNRGRDGIQGMLLGSTSRALVTQAPCPVVVVRRVEQRAQRREEPAEESVGP
ncbi:universal stress protein [Saccharomonospora sp.]|uniref:universal stress protein n=1 Tax=Saccharomonospora sp. TaxID=33913 RepID=UPI00260423EC|nr:universal stress protein [Saccharomonospora sp.]